MKSKADNRTRMLYRGFDLIFDKKNDIHVYRCHSYMSNFSTLKEAKQYVDNYLEPKK